MPLLVVLMSRVTTPVQMSRAGFTYNPAEDSADMVQCFHCGLALDGWEPHDDPLVEHLKRSPECDGIAASVRKKAKGKGKAAVAEDVATSRRSSTVSTVSTTSSRRAGRSRRKADGDVTMDDGASVVDSDASFMSVASSVGEASFVSAASDFVSCMRGFDFILWMR